MSDSIPVNMFWQYPVITEQTFFDQNKDNDNYIGFPWATLHDSFCTTIGRDSAFNMAYQLIHPQIKPGQISYTCCQHISFRKFIPLWERLNIRVVYASHKQLGENKIGNVVFKPCPLFAVNIESRVKNKVFLDVDFMNCERKYLYSFMGGYQPRDYMSFIRSDIYKIKHPDNTFIKNTGIWHFNDVVFHEKQSADGELNMTDKHINNTDTYNRVLLDSRYSLCPSGSGPNSIRLWESLAIGSIPILLSDHLELPKHQLWSKAILRVRESDVNKLSQILDKISKDQEIEMRKNCLKIYTDLKDNYNNE